MCPLVGGSHAGLGAIVVGRGLLQGGCHASQACSSLQEPDGRAWGQQRLCAGRGSQAPVGRVLTHTADPSPRPVEDLAACGAPPCARRGRRWVGDDAPSVRKPSLAIREGALGYWTPQPLRLPSVQWPPWRLPEHVGRAPRLRGRGAPPRGGAERPSLQNKKRK